VVRREHNLTRKCFENWCRLTPADPSFSQERQKLQATQYGRKLLAKLLDEPLAEQAATNASIVQVLKRDILPHQGKHVKGHFTATLCRPTNDSTLRQKATALGLSVNQVRYATWHEREAKQSDANGVCKRNKSAAATLAQNYPADVTRESLPAVIEQMYVDFFIDASYVPSGANNELRHVSQTQHELMEEMYAMYPAMLRTLSDDDLAHIFENTKRDSCTTYTVLQASILAVQHWEKAEGFDSRAEVNARRKVAKAIYRAKLNHSCWNRRGYAMGQPSPSGVQKTSDLQQISTWDPAKFDAVTPIDSEHFLDVLTRRNVRWTYNIHPTICKFCQDGPGQVAASKQVAKSIGDLMSEGVPENDPKVRDLKHKQDIIEANMMLYKIHQKQFNTCRPYIKEIEKTLKVGECVLYRDFVNQHNYLGDKVVNLILVKLWREKAGDDLSVLKIHNVVTDKATKGTTCDVMADVMDFHLKPKSMTGNGWFDDIHKIYLCGDHGSHFASTKTFWNESGMFEMYNKQIHCVFLCSYHGYNRCDGAGVQLKRVAQQAARNGRGPITERDYQHLMNTSAHLDSVCCVIPTVNRPVRRFRSDYNTSEDNISRKYCEVKYSYTNEKGGIAFRQGIYLARLFPGVGQFDVVDMLHRCCGWDSPCEESVQEMFQAAAKAVGS